MPLGFGGQALALVMNGTVFRPSRFFSCRLINIPSLRAPAPGLLVKVP